MRFLNDIKLEIETIEKNKRRFKHFGLVVGAIFVFFGIVLFVFWGYNPEWLIAIGVILVFFGICYPRLLYYPYIFWMGLATLIGFIISRFILIILFYSLVLPIGFLTRLFRGNFLNKKFDPKVSTYWIKYEQKNKTKKELEQLY